MTTLVVPLTDRLLIARRGQRWQTEEPLRGESLECAAVDPHRPTRIYCGTTEHGLWRSDDEGRRWEPAGRGIEGAHITAVAVDPLAAQDAVGAVYAGTEPSRLYRSGDGGSSWEELPGLRALPSSATWSFPPRPHTHHVRWIEPDPAAGGRLFIAIEAGALVRTIDGGRTWQDRVPDGPFDTHTLASHPLAPGRLYSAAGDGYFESSDAGATWRRVVGGLRHRYLVGVAVDRGDPETVIVSASAGPYSAYAPRTAESYVYRKTADVGWQVISDGLPDASGMTVTHFAAHPHIPGLIYAANNHGIFQSTDAGGRWGRLELDWQRLYESRGVRGICVLGAAG